MKWSLGSVLYYPETGEMKIPNMGIGIEKEDSDINISDNPAINNNSKDSLKTKETEKEDKINNEKEGNTDE